MAAIETSTRTLISPAQLNRPRGKFLYWTAFTITVVVFTLVFLGPLYWMITGGFKSTHEIIQNPPTVFPKHLNPDTYTTAWHHLNMARLLLNSIYYAFGALALQLIFDVAAAYALSKIRPVLGNVILGLMLATLMIPAAVLILPQYLTAVNLPIIHIGLVNTPWAIWLPSVANAFNIFLLKRFFDSIPEELIAAAAIDGATPVQTLLRVVLPISRPILGVVSIFATVNVWKDFLWPLLVEPDPTKQPVNIGINSLALNVSQNEIIAGLTIASIPTIVFFLIFQRNIMSGLTTGSLKG
jgi:multiple sugar transport system permease protein